MSIQTLPLRKDVSRLCAITETILEQTRAAGRKAEFRDFQWAPDYAEPGYHSPENGIVFSNWNPAVTGFDVSRAERRRDPVEKLARILEAAGCETEWADEWTTCCDCNKAVRTSADSYGWLPYYRILNECELVCLDCLKPADYLESIEDDPAHAAPADPRFCPLLHGYVQFEETFETGFHPGQNDKPAKILERMQKWGLKHCIFRLKAAGQFDLSWEAYHKPEPENEDPAV